MSSISRTVLREQVKDILLHRIVSGELKPGGRLGRPRRAGGAAQRRAGRVAEARRAGERGTSRAPVREALRDLELLRLVKSEPFRGARVRAFGDDELVAAYTVRAGIAQPAGP